MEKYFASNNIDGDLIWNIITAAPIYFRSKILEAWKNNKLYTVYEAGTKNIIPCFAIWSGTTRISLDLIWVDENKRGCGFARLMIEAIDPDIIFNPPCNTTKFWKKLGFVTKKGLYLLKQVEPIEIIEELEEPDTKIIY